jgi:hypothetical protein
VYDADNNSTAVASEEWPKVLDKLHRTSVQTIQWTRVEGGGEYDTVIVSADDAGKVCVWVHGGFCAVSCMPMQGQGVFEKVLVRISSDLRVLCCIAWEKEEQVPRVWWANAEFLADHHKAIQLVGVQIAQIGREFALVKEKCTEMGKVWKKTRSIFENKMSLLDDLLEKQGETLYSRKTALLAFITTG